MKENRHLTFISYYGPDDNMAASVRLKRMVSAFSEWGWTVKVLTPRGQGLNPNLPGRTMAQKFLKWLRYGRQLVDLTIQGFQHRQTGLFYISAPPHGMIFPAAALSLLTSTPIAFEERDLLSLNPLANFKSIRCGKPARWLEHWFLKRVRWVVLATQGLKEETLRHWPDLNSRLLMVVWNGFWKNDYAFLTKDVAVSARDERPLRLVHIGNFYGSRNPFPLLSAMENLKKTNPEIDLAQHFEFLFIGHWPDQKDKMEFLDKVRQAGFSEIFKFQDLLPRSKALGILNESDVAVVVTHSSGSEVAVPAKFYECVALGVPVLAITHDPLLVSAINRHKLGWCIPHDQTQFLAELFASWMQNPSVLRKNRLAPFSVAQFDAQTQIRKLHEKFQGEPAAQEVHG